VVRRPDRARAQREEAGGGGRGDEQHGERDAQRRDLRERRRRLHRKQAAEGDQHRHRRGDHQRLGGGVGSPSHLGREVHERDRGEGSRQRGLAAAPGDREPPGQRRGAEQPAEVEDDRGGGGGRGVEPEVAPGPDVEPLERIERAAQVAEADLGPDALGIEGAEGGEVAHAVDLGDGGEHEDPAGDPGGRQRPAHPQTP
jgi:hypothetical protein